MSEPFSLTRPLPGLAVLTVTGRYGTAVSEEADVIRRSASAVLEWRERSITLFGEKSAVIREIQAVAAAHGRMGWDGEEAYAVSLLAADQGEAFIRALPSDVPMPEVAPEPDGSISLDWIQSRNRLFSISIGLTDRLAFAWLDGTDRGHGVARFDRERIPSRILDAIRETMGHAAVRVA
jgi:hypothetical protein